MILSDISVTRPVLASVMSLLLIAVGLVAFDRLPLREYPDIQKVDGNADVIMWLNLVSDRLTVPELTDYARRYLVGRFSVLDGVARVRGGGNQIFAIRVWLDRHALAARGLTVADAAKAEMARVNANLPDGMELKQSYDTSVFVKGAIREVYKTLGIAIGLVVLVIFLFLGSVRAMLVTVSDVCLEAIAARPSSGLAEQGRRLGLRAGAPRLSQAAGFFSALQTGPAVAVRRHARGCGLAVRAAPPGNMPRKKIAAPSFCWSTGRKGQPTVESPRGWVSCKWGGKIVRSHRISN